MKTGILTFQIKHGRAKGSIGSSVIRGDWLAEKWDDAELWYNGGEFDAIIFQKVYWYYFLEDYKGIKILDLCDPDWMSQGFNLVETAQLVDGITCSTDKLTEYVSKIIKDKPVITIPDRLNLDHFQTKKKHNSKAESVSWFGYSGNAQVVLDSVLPSLAERNLKLFIIADKPFNPTVDYGVEIINIKWTPETAYQSIQNGDFTINPKSLKSNFKYKSNNKTLVSWGLGLPVADSAEDMDNFMEPENRQKDIDKRTKEIEEKWDIKYSIKQHKDLICKIGSEQKKKQ